MQLEKTGGRYLRSKKTPTELGTQKNKMKPPELGFPQMQLEQRCVADSYCLC